MTGRRAALPRPGGLPPAALPQARAALGGALAPLRPHLDGLLSRLDAHDAAEPCDLPLLGALKGEVGAADVEGLTLLWGGAEIAGEPSRPPRLLIGARALELPEPELRFLLARALESVRSGESLLRRLSVQEAQALLGATADLLDGAEPPGGPLVDALRALPFPPETLPPALARRLAAGLRAFSDPERDLEPDLHDAEAACDRVGLLLAGDLEASLRALARIEGWSAAQPGDVDARAALLERSHPMRELVAFATGRALDLWEWTPAGG